MIPWAQPYYWGNEQKYVEEAVVSTWISGGRFVDLLEQDFSKACGSQFCLSVANGTAALHLALLAAEVAPGDEVIVPGFGFLAAANISMHLGAKPVFAEVNPDTWCLDAESVESLVTDRTKAIVPVHTYGNACDMTAIMEIAGRHGITVIEDAAESLGTTWQRKWTGTIGHVGCFSFQATKTITCGEGGMVVTNDPKMKNTMALFRSHGMKRPKYYRHFLHGHNFRLTNMQAAMACAQFEKRDVIFSERYEIHRRYVKILSKEDMRLQTFLPETNPVPWSFPCLLGDSFGERDDVIRKMSDSGVETRPGFYPPSVQPMYSVERSIPTCERVASRMISLPASPPSKDLDVEAICDALLSAGERR